MEYWKVTIFTLCCLAGPGHSIEINDEYIRDLNERIPDGLWVAGKNFNDTDDVLPLLGVKPDERSQDEKNYKPFDAEKCKELPKSFDSREEWPNCQTIKHIWNQGDLCGSCWAVSSASVMSDRICVFNQKNVFLSDAQITACDHLGGSDGCGGGFPDAAFEYWITNGVVTGGDFKTRNTCWPYPNTKNLQTTPKCVDKCPNKRYRIPFEEDKHFGKIKYDVAKDSCAIMQEIYENGPVVATFAVYKDFHSYKHGVYVKVDDTLVGYHAVRIIGWGEDEASGQPYWLIANSWSETWGLKGLVKFLRGQDQCGIESMGVVTGTPCEVAGQSCT